MARGLIFDIRRYSVHDGPGIRTTVFFKGCPLSCSWCHNPESWLKEPQTIIRKRQLSGQIRHLKEKAGRWMRKEEVMEVLRKDRVFYEESHGGVSFSGGEPLMQADFLMALLKKCREEGLHTVIDTSGYAEESVFQEVAGQADLLLFDLKLADNRQHQQHTGLGNSLILKNLMALPADGPELLIRIPLVPGINDQTTQMEAIRDIIKQIKAKVIRVELLAFHRLGRHKYEALNMPVPEVFSRPHPVLDTSAYKEIFTRAGLQVKVGA